ncbi:MAG: DUF4186 domain-containing protein [Minisyncoccales bacterium]
MKNTEFILNNLQKSRFRSSFNLTKKDLEYIESKSISKIESHCLDFLNKRIKILSKKDGKQTPYKGHPVFIAQHATATCCRKCIEKWHKIPKSKELNEKEIIYLKNIIMRWIEKKVKEHQ